MKVLKLATGFAVGYVLGSRAGREKFEQIAATARKVRESPTVIQAQEKAKTLLGTGTSTSTTVPVVEATPRPRPPKTEPVSVTTPVTNGSPLV
ncbi:hypothetical protein BJ973_004789 [Actinoplanes tereljensis]|uniref:YtxH domain-containing protein n=1 Tax=Paractinoplanes tereljensis TaxID=571912 RepID=A0A919NP60_9ACTN|nr:hypothetical protein [Actinoplanes tereljensis]GIF21763.1 hypothetical protein Ate02nite_44930 [Actinoplanes tereljensis]